ncbi:fluoride efflux transporter FluC [Halorhodospira halophila]|uniref:Fluoride-specific ion channel FluC n=1 Tax=Halorhodospira halophila (strain DSM 244 / SL1) TaxID=349124 RepID=A1WYB6_HALHL|nr:CrcB family protein [Halorhodospira halophila]ABM62678.1 camphor resistance protein CrcB [Halorhodospira halophila SL1]MBK1728359.1 CrcB family protein [Halorhodospira halophila]
MRITLWVAAGSALGGVSRYGVDGVMVAAGWVAFPWGTLLVNTIGSLLIGIVAAWAASDPGERALPVHWRQFAVNGFCGGFTTFSIFNLETLALLERAPAWAGANVLATTVLCLGAVAIGYAVTQRRLGG